jgi:hypothetical protein
MTSAWFTPGAVSLGMAWCRRHAGACAVLILVALASWLLTRCALEPRATAPRTLTALHLEPARVSRQAPRTISPLVTNPPPTARATFDEEPAHATQTPSPLKPRARRRTPRIPLRDQFADPVNAADPDVGF